MLVHATYSIIVAKFEAGCDLRIRFRLSSFLAFELETDKAKPSWLEIGTYVQSAELFYVITRERAYDIMPNTLNIMYAIITVFS